jgi:hypothetical protein
MGTSVVERSAQPDAQCVAAVELARNAAQETAGAETVGEHLGFEVDGERLGTHLFACTSKAYAGWQWAVTVVRAARARVVTVDEVVLLPGPGALVAPEWVPFSERVQPGDLGVGDVLATAIDDPRLEPGYLSIDDPDVRAFAVELGLGRPRVLSLDGRNEAAQRWYDGDHGPRAPIAEAAPMPCSSCGFLMPISGALGQMFGLCANGLAPDDGRVVSLDHGCGAHSEALVVSSAPTPNIHPDAAQPPALPLAEPS